MLHPANAMRAILCQLQVLSVLYVSAEGAWDMKIESPAHRDSMAHQFDVDDRTPAKPDPLSGSSGVIPQVRVRTKGISG